MFSRVGDQPTATPPGRCTWHGCIIIRHVSPEGVKIGCMPTVICASPGWMASTFGVVAVFVSSGVCEYFIGMSPTTWNYDWHRVSRRSTVGPCTLDGSPVIFREGCCPPGNEHVTWPTEFVDLLPENQSHEKHQWSITFHFSLSNGDVSSDHLFDSRTQNNVDCRRLNLEWFSAPTPREIVPVRETTVSSRNSGVNYVTCTYADGQTWFDAGWSSSRNRCTEEVRRLFKVPSQLRLRCDARASRRPILNIATAMRIDLAMPSG